jgi:hypothetical protein
MNETQGLLSIIAEVDNPAVVSKQQTQKQRFKPYDQYQTYLALLQ